MAEIGSGGNYTSDPTVPGSSVSTTSGPSQKKRWKDTRTARGISAAGSSLSQSGQDEMDRASSDRITPVAYRKGGRVRKTGPAVVHKGERVIPAGKVKRVEKMMRKAKMRMKARA